MINKSECNYLDVARTLGIYIVILGHFMYSYRFNTIPFIFNSFHMPMFFMISGILHKPNQSFLNNLKYCFFSLVIPYFIYNMSAISFLVYKDGVDTGIQGVLSLVKGDFPVAQSSWFFTALFFVKVIASAVDKLKNGYVILSACCLLFFGVMNYLDLSALIPNIFMIKTAFFVFPFFAFGYLAANKISWTSDAFLLKSSLAILLLAVNIYSVLQWGAVNVVTAEFSNIFHYLLQPLSGALAIIFLSQAILPFVKSNFVKDISRGTMIIVGIHSFIMSAVLPNIFFGVKSLSYIVVVGFLFLLCFYAVIKLTFKRCPVLYGKWRPI